MFCFLFITVAKALHLDSYSWLQYPGSFWFSSHILRQPQYASSDPTTQGLWHPLLKYMHSSSAESLHQVSAWRTSTNSPEVSSSGSFLKLPFVLANSLSTLWTSSGQSPLLPHCQINRYYSDFITSFCSNKINHSLGPPLDNIIFLSISFGSLIYFWRVNWQNFLESILAILIQQIIFKHLWEYCQWVHL